MKNINKTAFIKNSLHFFKVSEEVHNIFAKEKTVSSELYFQYFKENGLQSMPTFVAIALDDFAQCSERRQAEPVCYVPESLQS